MKTKYLSIFFIFFTPLLWGQNVTIKVVFNNTIDMKKYEKTITELEYAVKTSELQSAINANSNMTDKNMNIDIVFFDRNYNGNMKLKKQHVLTTDEYKKRWKENSKNTTSVLFLYVKEYEKKEYNFYDLTVSELLGEEHLFEAVVSFINEHLRNKNMITTISDGSKYLARAITPVWNDEKKVAAEILIKDTKYEKDHINYFYGNWASTFIDIKPISNTNANLAKVWFLNKNDTIKPAISIYADMTVFKGTEVVVEGEGYIFSFLIKLLSFIGVQERIILLELKNSNADHNYVIPLITAMQDAQKYSSVKKVSEWNWEKKSGVFTLKPTEGLADYQENNKFELIKVSLNDSYPEGTKIPVIHPWYPRTFCNVYASDLTRQILFPNTFTSGSNYAPWGAHNSAAKLHDVLKDNTNGQFKPLSHEEAWKYTNAKYVVYLTAYSSKYYEKPQTVSPYDYSGHIVTCYETPFEAGKFNVSEVNVIQAGSKCGVLLFGGGAWGKTMTDNVIANVYLGYIVK